MIVYVCDVCCKEMNVAAIIQFFPVNKADKL